VYNKPTIFRDPSGLDGAGFGFNFNNGITWGNWGGWNYTNGGVGGFGELDPFPGSGSSGKPQFAPVDPTDVCFYQHDKCLNLGARIKNNDARKCFRHDCDITLGQCLWSCGSTLAPALSPYFTLVSPNNNPGDYLPGLGPDPSTAE
jgi:hypothetical protein